MNKISIITWISLVLLTIVSASFSNLENNLGALLIIGLAVFKFLVVGFQFMELKKAHTFWKVLLLCFIIIYAILVLII
ncbi:cytochrome C oxidase family protein [Tenacibaculum soleae]|uniref:cytochrome C oxidase subunit IV family protein n=1 Tax=Tenacibaculum soleae TaxID=447689 RepID=UPI003AB47E47